jgi:hypothetical protein
MTASGALGKGTYRAVIAGLAEKREFTPKYHTCSTELLMLHQAHRAVLRSFYVRDKILDSKFPSNSRTNGLFRLIPRRRYAWHFANVMPSIRQRTIWMSRIHAQRKINAELIEAASKSGVEHPAAALATADAAAYFAPQSFAGANHWPNFWQHSSMRHVLPKAQWERHPELGGITRVSTSSLGRQANDY